MTGRWRCVERPSAAERASSGRSRSYVSMSTRGIISSLAQSSESLSTPSIISTSAGANSPRSVANSSTDTSSPSERARRSRLSDLANALETARSTTLKGASTAPQNSIRRAHTGASRSARRRAICFGVISPKSRSSSVIAGTATNPPTSGSAATKTW